MFAERSLTQADVDRLFRHESGRAIASLVKRFGRLDLAEECVQEAFVRALEQWPIDGIPDNPGAWITTVARNRALDILRRDSTGARKVDELTRIEEAGYVRPAATDPTPLDEDFEDNRLRLILMCCHPALATEARVALTLNLVAGLSVESIARAFLVSPSTMARRLVRAKSKIRDARIPFSMPADDQLDDRLSDAQTVVYLIFNEGYSAGDREQLIDCDLCDEAIWVARLMRIFRPADPDLKALLALILLQDSRRDARVDSNGQIVLLADQDRSLWDLGKIVEGAALLTEVWESGHVGVYALQAAIAAEHSRAMGEADTAWEDIAEIYERLAEITPSPVLEINRSIAVGMAFGPERGLEVLDALDQASLAEYAPLHLAQADLLRRAGRAAAAADAYRAALELVTSPAQKIQIKKCLSELAG